MLPSTQGYTRLSMKGRCAAIAAARAFGKREIYAFKRPVTNYAKSIGATAIASCKDVTLFA